MDLDSYVRTYRQLDEARRSDRRRRAAMVRSRLPEVVRRLTVELGATKVVLFGSLLRGELHEGSDVDLAVEGLAAGTYFHAVDRAAEAAGVPVDLVPLEEASPELRALIEEEGEVLHG